MQFRFAKDEDIPAIVDLLKQSLGESLLPKSEIYWRWKHIQNPFGVSPVLLAVEGSTIIGVRAFMRWRWIDNARVVEAVRAVDTATHPAYQGKGIFSKLTLTLLEQCMQDGYRLIFNTPNNKSMPGYLKMGWLSGGNLPVRMKIIRPIHIAFNLLFGAGAHEPIKEPDQSLDKYLDHPGLSDLLKDHRLKYKSYLISDHSPTTLEWRYKNVPGVTYYAAGIDNANNLKGLFIYRLKKTKFGVELRITDLFQRSNADTHELRNLLKEKIRLHKVDYVSIEDVTKKSILSGLLAFSHKSIGPIVTVRSIGEDLEPYLQFRRWNPSVGDLELF